MGPKKHRENKPETGGALKRALGRLRDIWVPMNDHRDGGYFPLMVSAWQGWKLDDKIGFIAHLPSGSGVGLQVNRNVLRAFRFSVGAYRAYMALCFDWDRYGSTTNPNAAVGHQRYLILPTRPVAKRDGEGYILDPDGKVITAKGGVSVKSPYDRRAIRTGEREPNPARERYPEYDADDLAALCYPDNVVKNASKSNRAHMPVRARKDLRLVQAVGGATIERLGRNPNKDCVPWRIMPKDLYR